ncbi:hypothetical protein ES703_102892 [subsurface metagenome]|jgi:hypothetical protein
MAKKYGYYIISGFIPVYEQRLGMTISPGVFRDQDADEAKSYYRSISAKLPTTRKIMDFDNNTSLYFIKHDVDDLIMMIRAVRFIDAVKAFDDINLPRRVDEAAENLKQYVEMMEGHHGGIDVEDMHQRCRESFVKLLENVANLKVKFQL